MSTQYGSISTLAWLPAGVSTASIKQVSDKYYGNLIRSGDGPNNIQAFHSIEVITDTSNVLNCIPALGAGDGGGASGSNYILTEYNSEPMKGQLAKVTLVYSIFSEYDPYPTYNEQSSTKSIPITQWENGGSTFATIAGTGAAPLNGAIFDGNSATSSFQSWNPTSPYAGYENFECANISYTYTEYSTSEFSSDSDILGTIQTPTGAPALAGSGNWLLVGSNRSKTGYFYTLANTYNGATPKWNEIVYGS